MGPNEAFRLLADPNVDIIPPTDDILEHLPATRRVTRSLTGRTRVTPTAPTPAPVAAPPRPKAKGKANGGASSSDPNSTPKAYRIIIEFGTSDKKFLKKATEIRKGIEAAALPGVSVLCRKSKSRSGCFNIWTERTGHIFLSHVGLKKPYKELTEINVNKVVETIALYLKTRNGRPLMMRASYVMGKRIRY